MEQPYSKCPICGEYAWTRTHRCPTAWAVWHDTSGDPSKYYAADASGAAERYAADYDNGDYGLMNGHEITVIVCRWIDWLNASPETEADFAAFIEQQALYRCTGRVNPSYIATLVTKTAATPV